MKFFFSFLENFLPALNFTNFMRYTRPAPLRAALGFYVHHRRLICIFAFVWFIAIPACCATAEFIQFLFLFHIGIGNRNGFWCCPSASGAREVKAAAVAAAARRVYLIRAKPKLMASSRGHWRIQFVPSSAVPSLHFYELKYLFMFIFDSIYQFNLHLRQVKQSQWECPNSVNTNYTTNGNDSYNI